MKKIKVLSALFSKIIQTSSGGSVVSFWGAGFWCCKKTITVLSWVARPWWCRAESWVTARVMWSPGIPGVLGQPWLNYQKRWNCISTKLCPGYYFLLLSRSDVELDHCIVRDFPWPEKRFNQVTFCSVGLRSFCLQIEKVVLKECISDNRGNRSLLMAGFFFPGWFLPSTRITRVIWAVQVLPTNTKSSIPEERTYFKSYSSAPDWWSNCRGRFVSWLVLFILKTACKTSWTASQMEISGQSTYHSFLT